MLPVVARGDLTARVRLQRVPFPAAHHTPFQQGDFKNSSKGPKLGPTYQQRCRSAIFIGFIAATAQSNYNVGCQIGIFCRYLPPPQVLASYIRTQKFVAPRK